MKTTQIDIMQFESTQTNVDTIIDCYEGHLQM